MNYLFLIPARGGSKGIPHKNIKILNNKPLIHYAINLAQEFSANEDICVSTDDLNIKSSAEQCGLSLPFMRPMELATDESTTFEVIRHAVNFYQANSKIYDAIILLQPTSPLRLKEDITNALKLFEGSKCDAVMSVCEAPSNPYYVHFTEDEHGNLKKLLSNNSTRRQDVPTVYEVNGAVYILRTKSIIKYDSILEFPSIIKSVMPVERSIDLDTEFDWKIAESILSINKAK